MSEFSSMHTSKCDVHDMLRSDVSAFQRQQQRWVNTSHSCAQYALGAKCVMIFIINHDNDNYRQAMSASCGSIDDLTCQENKMLKQKLEAMQTLQVGAAVVLRMKLWVL